MIIGNNEYAELKIINENDELIASITDENIIALNDNTVVLTSNYED